MLSPADLGAPARYTEWRHGQDEAFSHAMMSDRRYLLLSLGTGVGKSLIGTTLQKTLDMPALYLVETRGLQDQVGQEHVGHDVRGMANYECVEEGGTCDQASCVDGVFCKTRLGGCHYFDNVRAAASKPLVFSNYAWWFNSAGKDGLDIGRRPLLICDEAHSAADLMASHLRVELRAAECEGQMKLGPRWKTWDAEAWRTWAAGTLPHVEREKRQALTKDRRRKMRVLGDKLTALLGLTEDWLRHPEEDRITFEPLWPHERAEELLFRGAEKVVLMSATMQPAQLRYLGIEEGEYDFFDGGSPLPVARRPIYHVPLARLSRHTAPEVWAMWAEMIDQIIDARLDRKGLIHTISYDRAAFLLSRSRHAKRMLVHERGQTARAVASFKDMPAGHLLVSPAIGTGWNFPFCAANYQIIGKFPWAPTSPIIEARNLHDGAYDKQLAVNDLVQLSGRCMRDPKDYCETFIVDDHVDWIRKAFRQFFPSYWLAAYRSLGMTGFGKINWPRPLPLEQLAACP